MKKILKSAFEGLVSLANREAIRMAQNQVRRLLERQLIIKTIKLAAFASAALVLYYKFLGPRISLIIGGIILIGISVFSIVLFLQNLPLTLVGIFSFLDNLFNEGDIFSSDFYKRIIADIIEFKLELVAWVPLINLGLGLLNLQNKLVTSKHLAHFAWEYAVKNSLMKIIPLLLLWGFSTLGFVRLLFVEMTGIKANFLSFLFIPYTVAWDGFFGTHATDIVIRWLSFI